MSVLILYLSTAVVFLVLDAIMLSRVMRPLFEGYIGDMLADELRLAPAAGFYLFYVAALLWLVSWPALTQDGYGRLILNAAIFGAAAYGTYEFTNLATLKGWSWRMVVVDVTWGAVLTAVSATAGVAITRALS
jgi:uncharacterized membrane protein